MFKKILMAALIAIPAFGFAQSKFGVVNSETIIKAMPEMADAQKQLEEASQKYQTEFNSFTEEFNKKYEEYQKLGADATPTIRERREKDLQDLQMRMGEFRQTAEQDLQRQQESLFAPIQQKVQDAVNAVGKEGNFTFIFEQMIPVYAGADVVDITNAVKAKLGIK